MKRFIAGLPVCPWICSFAALFFSPEGLFAQNTGLFFPRNFEAAYEKGTRSADGAPGPNYWQNRATYTMDIELAPKTKLVKGSANIVYFNNSPDKLTIIRLKLQHDLYRKGGQRDSDIPLMDVSDGVKLTKVEVNGKAVPTKSQNRRETFLDLRLDQPLGPKASLQIGIDWSFTMPASKNATRECVCDPGSFFIPYFYPQIAVYDDLHGWASAPYNGLQEFYHDFADYAVNITVPKGFMVWATGEWQNPAEILEPAYLERWNRAHGSAEIISIFNEAELKTGNVLKKTKQHTYRYKAGDVPDFTFAASDHYNWDASSVVVDERTGRRTFVGAAYHSDSKDFLRVARIAADGLRLMSTWLPGYPFPYPCLTVFNGNDGMEYPMMINDKSVSEEEVVGLTIHESAHSYFPFMVGINEQYYAWMDEGWANFFDYFVGDSLQQKKSGLWAGSFGQDWDVPPMTPSRFLSGNAYTHAAYTRPQIAYMQLYDLLGYEAFRRCMSVFMDRWKGKHPGPYDFFYTFNNASGQNLDWFWKPWFFEWGYPDLGIQKVENGVVVVERKGTMPVPVHLEIEYADGSKETVHKTCAVWQNGETIFSMVPTPGKAIKKIKLGNRMIPDVRTKNNVWPN
jgi:hypothetical protein